ncbi:MAG: methionyl-tRNA formyltransferase [bacterium]
MRIKTLFFGSPEFGLTILKSLISLDYIEIVGIVTQPDKEFGRKKVLKSTPVKEFIKQSHPEIKVFEPVKLKAVALDILEEAKPELIVVAAYGKILPDSIINYPKYKCLNVHGSLLPILRGAVPVQMAILKGFKETGVSIQIMKQEMDEGDILFSKSIIIEDRDTSKTLMDKMAVLGSEIIKSNLTDYIEGKVTPIKQDSTKATYCFLTDLSYEKALIDWGKDSTEIDRLIRTFNPEPIAYTNGLVVKLMDKFVCNIKIDGKVKIYESSLLESSDNLEIPQNLEIHTGEGIVLNGKLLIKTSGNFICILKLQLEGKNIVSSSDFINGLKNRV